MASASKRNTLTIEKKLQVLEALKSKKQPDVAEKFNVSQSTISKIKKAEKEIRHEALTNGNLNRKRKRESPNEEVADSLMEWFYQMRQQNAVINGPLMMEKAQQLAVMLGRTSFVPTNGWLERLKIRYNITFMKIGGERAAADHTGAENWITNVLPTLIEGYDASDIFNADETGLFYKAAPSGTLAVTGTQPTGGKTAKERMTVLLLCNANGTEKKAYVVGKFANPRCFRTALPPLPYFSNSNAWMTSRIWADIILKFDRELGNRKIILFADNAACHKVEGQLKNIKLEFIPPNTTSLIQPLDQGIIRTMKVHYRTQVMRKMLQAIEEGCSIIDYAKSIDVLVALHMLKQAWLLVSPATIRNCFRKAGFPTVGPDDNEDDVLPIPAVTAELGEAVTQEDFETFVDCDNEVACHGTSTDAEICEQVQRKRQNWNDDNDTEEFEGMQLSEARRVTHKEALSALATVRHYLEQNLTEYNEYYAIADKIEKNASKNRMQRKITDFFK